jgi:hypothetical protein
MLFSYLSLISFDNAVMPVQIIGWDHQNGNNLENVLMECKRKVILLNLPKALGSVCRSWHALMFAQEQEM